MHLVQPRRWGQQCSESRPLSKLRTNLAILNSRNSVTIWFLSYAYKKLWHSCRFSRKCLYYIKDKNIPWDHPLASGDDPQTVRFYRWAAVILLWYGCLYISVDTESLYRCRRPSVSSWLLNLMQELQNRYNKTHRNTNLSCMKALDFGTPDLAKSISTWQLPSFPKSWSPGNEGTQKKDLRKTL